MSNSPLQSAPESSEGDSSLSRSLLHTLANERRRTTLTVLADASTPIDARTVARRVAARETSGGVATDRIEDVHVSLHHIHLPALADVGLASYDPERGVVIDAVEDVESILS